MDPDCAVTEGCDTWVISTSGAAQCWVKRGGGATLQNPDRGVGKVSPEYLARGCPPSLTGGWGASLLALFALLAAG